MIWLFNNYDISELVAKFPVFSHDNVDEHIKYSYQYINDNTDYFEEQRIAKINV